jgi:hypothetical protein
MKEEQIGIIALQGKKIYGSYSEPAGSLLVSVKIDGLENFWNN